MTDENKKEETTPETEETKTEETPAEKAEEKKEESPAETPATDEGEAEEEVEVPEKFKKIVSEIEEMSVLELNELVKVFEKKFGVSATAVAAAGPANGGEAEEEKDSFTVELADVGAQKIAVIKVIKEALGLGLKEAKDLVDGAPSVLKEDVKKEDAEDMKAKIEEAGGKVNLK